VQCRDGHALARPVLHDLAHHRGERFIIHQVRLVEHDKPRDLHKAKIIQNPFDRFKLLPPARA
jgi:hypothetical protein